MGHHAQPTRRLISGPCAPRTQQDPEAHRQHPRGLLHKWLTASTRDSSWQGTVPKPLQTWRALTIAELECRGRMQPSWNTRNQPSTAQPAASSNGTWDTPHSTQAWPAMFHGHSHCHTHTHTYPGSTSVRPVPTVAFWSLPACCPLEAATVSTVKQGQGSLSETNAREGPQRASPSSHGRPMPSAHASVCLGTCPPHAAQPGTDGWPHGLSKPAVPSFPPSRPPSTAGLVLDTPGTRSLGKLASPLGVHTRALQMGPVARHICSYSHARVDRSITSPWFLVTPAPGQGQESGSILPRELPLPHHLVPARHRTLEVRAKGATREGEGFGNNFQPPAPTMLAWAHNRLGACPGALDTTGAMRERAALGPSSPTASHDMTHLPPARPSSVVPLQLC